MRSLIPNIKEDPMVNYKKHITKGKKIFDFKQTSVVSVLNIIKNIHKTKSTGTDNIPMFVIKDQIDIISPIISHIFNLCIQQDIYPNKLKIMKIVPILKPKKTQIYPYLTDQST